jgi:hypothetical protein
MTDYELHIGDIWEFCTLKHTLIISSEPDAS